MCVYRNLYSLPIMLLINILHQKNSDQAVLWKYQKWNEAGCWLHCLENDELIGRMLAFTELVFIHIRLCGVHVCSGHRLHWCDLSFARKRWFVRVIHSCLTIVFIKCSKRTYTVIRIVWRGREFVPGVYILSQMQEKLIIRGKRSVRFSKLLQYQNVLVSWVFSNVLIENF